LGAVPVVGFAVARDQFLQPQPVRSFVGADIVESGLGGRCRFAKNPEPPAVEQRRALSPELQQS
jgi:hypothetical protein